MNPFPRDGADFAIPTGKAREVRQPPNRHSPNTYSCRRLVRAAVFRHSHRMLRPSSDLNTNLETRMDGYFQHLGENARAAFNNHDRHRIPSPRRSQSLGLSVRQSVIMASVPVRRSQTKNQQGQTR